MPISTPAGATEAVLAPITARERRGLVGADQIGLRVGKWSQSSRWPKHFDLAIQPRHHPV